MFCGSSLGANPVYREAVIALGREIARQNLRRRQRRPEYLRPGLDKMFYDAKCVQVSDPFGNRIRFYESLKAENPT